MRSSSQQKIKEMQCELLVSNFRDPKTIARMKENLGRISDGSSPHCGGMLKLGLKKAFEVKQRKAGVLLRCPSFGCKWSSNDVPFRSVIGKSCPACRTWYMKCASCGHGRTTDTVSCLGCGKKFA